MVHEATNAFLPGMDGRGETAETAETVRAKTITHGHSTPEMAGRFARDVRAATLVLTHFSTRYKPDDEATIGAITALASAECSAAVHAARCAIIAAIIAGLACTCQQPVS